MLGHGHRLQISLWRSVHRVDDVNQHLLAPFIDVNYLASIFIAPVFVTAKENRYSATLFSFFYNSKLCKSMVTKSRGSISNCTHGAASTVSST